MLQLSAGFGIKYVFAAEKRQNMKQGNKSTLNYRTIFRYMMEEGYHPQFEKSHILFDIDDNTGVVQYQEDILTIRVFFTIDAEAYSLFLETSNSTMLESFMVKPVVMDDMGTIMFSCEMLCDNLRELRKFFPRGIERLRESLTIHRAEMKKAISTQDTSCIFPASASGALLS